MAFFHLSLPIIALALSISAIAISAQQDGGPQGPAPPPPFLQGASQQKIDEFHQMLANSGHMTDAQIEDAVKQWISNQDADIKTKFAAFEDEKNKMEAAQEQVHQQALAKFSPKAKEADAKLSQIAKDPTLAAQEKAKQIEEFVKSLPQEVRDEIERAMMGSRGGMN